VLQLRSLAATGIERYIEPSLLTFPNKSVIGGSGISGLPAGTVAAQLPTRSGLADACSRLAEVDQSTG
jgi:hypothetical protein